MPSKKIAPAAIVALKEALTNLYWYKGDLRSFLTSTVTNSALLSRLNWGDYKRNVVGELIAFLERRQDEYQADLLRLMTEVGRVDDFSHLERLEGGKQKAATARASVRALRKLTEAHESLFDEQKRMEERRRKTHEAMLRTTAVRTRLEGLTKRSTSSCSGPRSRSSAGTGWRRSSAPCSSCSTWTHVLPLRLSASRLMAPLPLMPRTICLKASGSRSLSGQPISTFSLASCPANSTTRSGSSCLSMVSRRMASGLTPLAAG